MIIDDIGELAALYQMSRECSRASIAALDRIQELQDSGRADCNLDLGMKNLIESVTGIFACIEELERRYPELADIMLRNHTENRSSRRRRMNLIDSKIRKNILNLEEKHVKIPKRRVYKCKVSVRN